MSRRTPARPAARAAHAPQRRAARQLLVLALVVLGARPGFPQDASEAPAAPRDDAQHPTTARRKASARAGDAVVAAHRAADAAALAKLASSNDPDPWYVVDDLVARGAFDAAAAFASAAKGPDVATLAAYVADRRGATDDPAAREACNEGEAALRSKDYERALAAYGKTRASAVPVLGTYGSRGVALALSGLGRRADAISMYVEAADRAARIGWLRRVPLVLLEAADCADAIGDTPTSLAIRERIVRAQTERGARRSLASALWNVGFVYSGLRQPDRALRYFERSREELVSVGSAWGEARMLQAEGDCLLALGRLAASRASLDRAIELYDRVGAPRTRARCRLTAAATLRRLGLREETVAMLEQAASLYAADKDANGAARAILAIADVHAEAGDWPAQVRTLERVEREFPSAQRTTTRSELLMRWGAVRARDGDVAAALNCEVEALEFAARSRSRGRTADVMAAARTILRAAADPDLAVVFHESARQTACRHGDARLEAGALGGLAAAHLAAGRVDEAVVTARAALVCMNDLPAPLGEEQWAGLRGEFPEAIGAGCAASARAGDAAGVLAFLEAGRATALLASMRGAAAELPVPEDLRDVERSSRDAETAAVARLRDAVESGDGEAAEAARAALDDARADRRFVLEQIRRRTHPAPSADEASRAALDAVRARLQPDEAFVSFGVSTQPGLDFALALVVTRETTRIVPLGTGSAVEDAFASIAADPARDAADRADALRKLVTDPLRLDAATQRVTVSPDGALAHAPPALLFPGRDVSYVPSGAAHGILHERARNRGVSVLALGDPEYDAGGAGTERAVSLRGGVVLGRLPATGDEAKAVGDVVLTRGAASEPGLRAALATKPRWRAVHLACHGFADERNMLFSSLALTPAPGDDGFLTALEVHGMRVPADLVTLSACDTGRGRLYPGEGSAGLAQAFMVAGASSVLVALWKVDDAATSALMTRFYDRFRKGVPAARALREAQESVRAEERWAHPRFWAAWALWGDGG